MKTLQTFLLRWKYLLNHALSRSDKGTSSGHVCRPVKRGVAVWWKEVWVGVAGVGGKGDFCTALCFFVLCTFGLMHGQYGTWTILTIF